MVALQALSAVQFHLGNFAESERIQRQALALNPNDPDTLAQLGWRLAIRGRWDEGLPYIERAIARTINPPGWYYDMITIHLYLAGPLPRDARLGRALGGRRSHWRVAPRHRLRRPRKPRGGAGGAGHDGGAVAALARDPAAVYRRFQPLESIVDALVDGLRKAGWTEPRAPATRGK